MHARALYLVYTALLALLAATVGASFIFSGTAALAASLAIATAMIALVGLFFMHLHEQPALINLAAVAGLAWVAILFWLMMNDYWTRV